MKKVMMMMGLLILISLIYVVIGSVMHAQVVTEEAKFHALQANYWNNEKSIRDAATTGSALNSQLIDIQNYPSELLRLKLVGVGRLLTGIYILLLGILIALIMMPMRLAQIIKGKSKH